MATGKGKAVWGSRPANMRPGRKLPRENHAIDGPIQWLNKPWGSRDGCGEREGGIVVEHPEGPGDSQASRKVAMRLSRQATNLLKPLEGVEITLAAIRKKSAAQGRIWSGRAPMPRAKPTR